MRQSFSTLFSEEDSSFEEFRKTKIDAKKHTLYEVLFDQRLDQLTMSERLKIYDGWHHDMVYRQIAHFQRYGINGCATERDIVVPSGEKTIHMVNFASNDYLNMSQHPSVINAAIQALQKYGAGAGAACNASGQTKVKEDLEKEITDTFEYEKALVFPSGYATNVGVLGALLRSNDVAIVDMYAHASIMDGIENKNKMLFKHNDMSSLESVLSRANRQYVNKIVVVDGVYSMDGDIANLPEISALCRKYDAMLMVDEAHAFGVIGKKGMGILDHFNMPAESVDIMIGTLSKSIGCSGGFVTGKRELINYLEFAARPYLFSTGPFIASNAAALESIRIIKEDTERRTNLWKNINYFRLKLKQSGFNIGSAETAIFPIILGDHNKVLDVPRIMGNNGVQVNGMPYPIVPRKQTRIRMTVTSEMTVEHLTKGYVELRNAIDEYDNGNAIGTAVVKDPLNVVYQRNISNKRQSILESKNETNIESNK